MKKDECEKAIRRLVHDWAHEVGFRIESGDDPSFTEFKIWMDRKGYGGYFDFRARPYPLYVAEQWFDQELKQTWRN